MSSYKCYYKWINVNGETFPVEAGNLFEKIRGAAGGKVIDRVLDNPDKYTSWGSVLKWAVGLDYKRQCSPLSLVEECQGSALIGRDLHSVAPPALLCHKEPARASKAPN